MGTRSNRRLRASSISIIATAFAILGIGDSWANPAAFTTLDRTALGSHVSGDLAFSFQDRPGGFGAQQVGLTSLRLDVRAHWVNRKGDLGAFLHLPVSAVFVSDRFSGLDDKFTLANIEAGGLYIIRERSFDIVFRGGIALPTAGDDFASQTANFSASYSRLTDFALAFPNTTWLRASASILGGRPRGLYWRVDAGVDVPVSEPNNVDLDPLLRVNAGVGYRLRRVAVMGELVNLINSDLGPQNDDMTHTLAITARSYHFKVVPSVGIVLPIDSTLRNIGFDFGFTIGLRGRL